MTTACKTREEWLATLGSERSFACLDCNAQTGRHYGGIKEYYSVYAAIWHSVVPLSWGMLCIGCLEKRLGRKLSPSDFLQCPINEDNPEWPKSARLRARLGLPEVVDA